MTVSHPYKPPKRRNWGYWVEPACCLAIGLLVGFVLLSPMSPVVVSPPTIPTIEPIINFEELIDRITALENSVAALERRPIPKPVHPQPLPPDLTKRMEIIEAKIKALDSHMTELHSETIAYEWSLSRWGDQIATYCTALAGRLDRDEAARVEQPNHPAEKIGSP
jgi:hypothetical protein